jgi:hypothetical protein
MDENVLVRTAGVLQGGETVVVQVSGGRSRAS